jgi:ribosomal-protein-serine acetyltransferase
MPVSLLSPPPLIRIRVNDQFLILKAARVEDAQMVSEAVNDSLPEFRQFFSWAFLPSSAEQQAERLKLSIDNLDKRGEISFHLFESEDGPLIGSISFVRQRVINPKAVELGYWIRTCAAGRGLATLATRCLCVVAFDYLGCTRIQCFFDENNIASKRVCEKVGFQYEARLRNFGSEPTVELRAQGDLSTGHHILNVLFPEDRASLSWYPEIAQKLEVFDESGNPAAPEYSG